jgi:hypothetical protein
MWQNIAKNTAEAKFILKRMKTELEEHLDGEGPAAKRKKGELTAAFNRVKAKNKQGIVDTNCLFNEDVQGDLREKILADLNEFRRRKKSSTIRIDAKTKEVLLEIKKKKGLSDVNKVVKLLLKQYGSPRKSTKNK